MTARARINAPVNGDGSFLYSEIQVPTLSEVLRRWDAGYPAFIVLAIGLLVITYEVLSPHSNLRLTTGLLVSILLVGQLIFRLSSRLLVAVGDDGILLLRRPQEHTFRHIPISCISNCYVASAPQFHFDVDEVGVFQWGFKGNHYYWGGCGGVVIILADGRQMFIATSNPIALQNAIEKARRRFSPESG